MLKERVAAAKRITTDLHDAEKAIDEAIIKIAKLAVTLPTARFDTNMSAIVGQDAVGKVTQAVAAAGTVRQMLAEAHVALSETQKQVGAGCPHVWRRHEQTAKRQPCCTTTHQPECRSRC